MHNLKSPITLYNVSNAQIVLMAILVSIIISAVVTINMLLKDHLLLPQVVFSSADNKCIKVINFENGHAFNCNDVNIILRRYRKVME